jgi:hypothetical protein
MKISKRLINSLIWTFVIVLTVIYILNSTTTFIDDSIAKDIETLSIQEMIQQHNMTLPLIHFVEFDTNTKQSIEISQVRYGDNLFNIKGEGMITSQFPINMITSSIIEKDKVEGYPQIRFNNEDINVLELKTKTGGPSDGVLCTNCGEENIFYALPNLQIKGNNFVNKYEINLNLFREIYEINEIKTPWFFNKISYTRSINLPSSLLPIIIKKNNESDYLTYILNLPPYERIDKKTSGWQKVYFYYHPIYLESDNEVIGKFRIGSYEPQRNGTINQTIIKENNKYIFKTKISEDNLPYNFEVTFLPSRIFFFIVVLFYWTPLTYFKLKKRKHNPKDLLKIYGIIISIFGLSNITNIDETLTLLVRCFHYINPLFLIFTFIFPLVYYFIFKKK